MKKLLLPLLVCVPVATVATSCTPNPDTDEPSFYEWDILTLSDFSISSNTPIALRSIDNLQAKKNLAIKYEDSFSKNKVQNFYTTDFNQIDELNHIQSLGFWDGTLKIGTNGKQPFAQSKNFKFIDFNGTTLNALNITDGFFYIDGAYSGKGISLKFNISSTNINTIFANTNFLKDSSSNKYTKIRNIYINNGDTFYEKWGKNTALWGQELPRDIIKPLSEANFKFNWDV